MNRRLPPLAIALGLGGLVPFVACGIAAALWRDPARPLAALIGYGAVILSFLGAVHWGLALEQRGRADAPRLVLGVVPALLGWVALLALQDGMADAALALLAAGFAATLAVEQRSAARGLLARDYLMLRWVLTAVVVVVLLAVMFLRLAGPAG